MATPRRLVICVALALALSSANAQTGQVLSAADGLSSYAVTSLLQDQLGFVWIGTTDGLNRYDGFAFTAFRSIPGDSTTLSNSIISTHGIAEDTQGYIWVGTQRGLNRLDPRTGAVRQFLHDPDDPGSLTNDHIRQVLAAPSGTVWIATFEGGVNRYDPALETFTALRHDALVPTGLPSSDTTLSVLETVEGLWIGGGGGLTLAPADGGPLTRFSLDTPEPWISSLTVDGAGLIWAGGTGMVYRLHPRTRAVIRTPFVPPEETTRYVLDLFVDGDERVWAGTWGAGLVQLEQSTGRILRTLTPGPAPDSPPSHRVSSFMRDRSGVLWIGTWDGLTRLPATRPFVSLPFNARTTAVALENDGSFWVSSIGGGLHRVGRGPSQAVGRAEGLPSMDVLSVMRDRSGHVWAGTSSRGVVRIDARTGMMRIYDASPTSIPRLRDNLIYKVFEDSRRRIWLATVHDGLALLDPLGQQVMHFLHDPDDPTSIPSNSVWTVFEDSRGRLWVGTIDGGLARIQIVEDDAFPPTLRFERVGADSLRSRNVVSLYEDDAGALWVGTMGGGLSRVDPEDDHITTWSVEDGLPDATVACILGDAAGRLWLGTGNGLARMDTDAVGESGRPRRAFLHYSLADGLPGMEFYGDGCTREPDGRLHFAVDSYVVSFDPALFSDNLVPPRVIVSDVLLFNTPMALDTLASYKRMLRLRHDQNFLAFTYAALAFDAPEKNGYEYRMDGVDAGWVPDLGGRLASYPNLSPGTYTFRVRGSNNDSVLGPETRMSIKIQAAFYQTVWFQLAGIVLLLSLPAAFVWARIRERDHLNATRQQIADDLHDDMGSRLDGMAMFLNRLLRNGSIAEAERQRAHAHMDSARQMTGDLSDHVWLIEPEYDTLGHLVSHLQRAAQTLVSPDLLEIEVHGLDTERSLAMEPRRHVYMMTKEALRNAVRHSGASTIRLRIVASKDALRIEVIDNGNGFPAGRGATGKLLHTLPRRARAVGANLEIESSEGQGATIRITLHLT